MNLTEKKALVSDLIDKIQDDKEIDLILMYFGINEKNVDSLEVDAFFDDFASEHHAVLKKLAQ